MSYLWSLAARQLTSKQDIPFRLRPILVYSSPPLPSVITQVSVRVRRSRVRTASCVSLIVKDSFLPLFPFPGRYISRSDKHPFYAGAGMPRDLAPKKGTSGNQVRCSSVHFSQVCSIGMIHLSEGNFLIHKDVLIALIRDTSCNSIIFSLFSRDLYALISVADYDLMRHLPVVKYFSFHDSRKSWGV